MGENVGQKMMCRTCSINPKNIFGQIVGKVVRLTQNADIPFLHGNFAQLANTNDDHVKNRHAKLYKQVALKSLPVILTNILSQFVPYLTLQNRFCCR